MSSINKIVKIIVYTLAVLLCILTQSSVLYAQTSNSGTLEFLAGFDGDFRDYSHNTSRPMTVGNLVNPIFDGPTQSDGWLPKFGSGTMKLTGGTGGSDSSGISFVPQNNNSQGEISLGTGEFTIDFWFYPYGLKHNGLEFWKEYNSNPTKSTLSKPHNLFYAIQNQVNSLFLLDTIKLARFNGGYKFIVFQNNSSFEVSSNLSSDIVENQWNHIAIQRVNSKDGSSFVVSINGKAGTVVNKALDFSLPKINRLYFGQPQVMNPLGDIDEFRIIKDKALWPGAAAGQAYIIPTTSAITQDVLNSAPAYDVSFLKIKPENISSSFLLHFDTNLLDVSGKEPVMSSGVVPVVSVGQKQVGTGSASFNSTSGTVTYDTGVALSATDDFTIDFWAYPRGFQKDINKSLVLLKLSDGTTNYFLRTHIYSTFLNTQLQFGPLSSVVDPTWYNSMLSEGTSQSSDSLYRIMLKEKTWNHIVIQRYKGELLYIINGAASRNAYFMNNVNSRFALTPFSGKSLSLSMGGVIPITGTQAIAGEVPVAFDGYIDEVRITKGALWPNVQKDDQVAYVPSVVGDTVKSSNLAIFDRSVEAFMAADTNVIPGNIAWFEQAFSAVSGTSVESNQSETVPARTITSEQLFSRTNGAPFYTEYYDSGDKLVASAIWAGSGVTSGDKKIKYSEYFEDSGLYQETFYSPNGAVTDIYRYYSKADGGRLFTQIENRNGLERYRRYSADGDEQYSHEYRNGAFVYAKRKAVSLDGITQNVVCFSADCLNFERKIISSNSTVVYSVTGTAYKFTITDYKGGKILFQKESAGTIGNNGSVVPSYRKVTTYSSNGATPSTEIVINFLGSPQNTAVLKTYSTDSLSVSYGKIDKEEMWLVDSSFNPTGQRMYKMSYTYNSDGVLVSKLKEEKTQLDFTTTTYRPDDSVKKLKKIAGTIYSDGSFGTVTEYSFDRNNKEVARVVTALKKGWVIEKIDRYTLTVLASRTTFDTDGSCPIRGDYFEKGNESIVRYSIVGTCDSGKITYVYSYMVPGGKSVAYKTEVRSIFTGVLISTPTNDELFQTKSAEARYFKPSGLLSWALNEADTVFAVTKLILSKYIADVKAEADSNKKLSLYYDYADELSWAVKSVTNHFHSNSTVKNNDRTFEESALPWVVPAGQSITNKQIYGFYIKLGGIESNASNARLAFIDMDPANVAELQAKLAAATSYADLEKWPKQMGKFDSLGNTDGSGLIVGTDNNWKIFSAKNSTDRTTRLTVEELTRPDPATNRIVESFMQSSSGLLLKIKKSANKLTPDEVIKIFYSYFYDQYYFTYEHDLAGVAQTLAQTMSRPGGNCQEFAVTAATLLRSIFVSLGMAEEAKNVGLATVTVTVSPTSDTATLGHIGVVYKNTNDSLTYIESIYLFQGMGATVPLETYPEITIEKNRLSKLLSPNKNIDGWKVNMSSYSLVGTLPVGSENSSSVGNSIYPINDVASYIEPHDPKIEALVSVLYPFIPRLFEQSKEGLAEYVHSVLTPYFSYDSSEPDGKPWEKVAQILDGVVGTDGTVAPGSIKGDCDELAFVEASVLQNLLEGRYIMRNLAPAMAKLAASEDVMLFAIRKDANSAVAHMFPGVVTYMNNNALTRVLPLDPQISAPQSTIDFRTMMDENMLFYANKAFGTVAVSSDDLSATVFKSKVDAPAGDEPAPSEKVVPKSYFDGDGKEISAEQAAELQVELAWLEAASAKIDHVEALIVAQEKIVADVLAKNTELQSKTVENIDAGTNTAVTPAVTNTNVPIIDNNNAGNLGTFGATKTDSAVPGSTNTPGNFGTFGAEPSAPAAAGNGPSNFSYTFGATQPELTQPTLVQNMFTAPGGGPAPSVFTNVLNFIGGLFSGGPGINYSMYGSGGNTFSPSGIVTTFGNNPNLNITATPNVLYIPLAMPDSASMCPTGVTVSKMCSDVSGNVITTKPDNSFFVGKDSCASVAGSCSDDKLFYTGWVCNLGFTMSLDKKSCVPNNKPPLTPVITSMPANTNFSKTAQTYTFVSTDPDKDNLYYQIKWNGDSKLEIQPLTGSIASGIAVLSSQTWPTDGAFTIEARAIDTSGAISPWGKLVVNISNNSAPLAPVITSASSNTNNPLHSETYLFKSTDPDGDNLFYEIQWSGKSDDVYGIVRVPAGNAFVAHNTNQSANNTWPKVGTYTFIVRAVDVHGSKSPWTAYSPEITPPGFDFSLRGPDLITIIQGNSADATIVKNVVEGDASEVVLTASINKISGSPDLTVTLPHKTDCTPTCNEVVQISSDNFVGVNIAKVTYYTLTVVGTAKNDSLIKHTISIPVRFVPAPRVVLTASPNPVLDTAIGDLESYQSTLMWTSTGAKSCSAKSDPVGVWAGVKKLSGSETITMDKYTLFTITCTGEGGKADAIVDADVIHSKALSVLLTANPSAGRLVDGSFETMLTASLKNQTGDVKYRFNCEGGPELKSQRLITALVSDDSFTFKCNYSFSGIHQPTVFVYDDNNPTIPVVASNLVFTDGLEVVLEAVPNKGAIPFTPLLQVKFQNYNSPVKYHINCNGSTLPANENGVNAISTAVNSTTDGEYSFFNVTDCTYDTVGQKTPTVFVYDDNNTRLPVIASTKVTAIVPPPVVGFDFSLSGPKEIVLTQGATTEVEISKDLVQGVGGNVHLALSVAPIAGGPNVTATLINSTDCTPTCAETVRLSADNSLGNNVTDIKKYSLTVVGTAKNDSTNTHTLIIPIRLVPAPRVTLTASPNPVAETAVSPLAPYETVLEWSSISATSCTASSDQPGLWTGDKKISGKEKVALSKNTKFSIVCVGDGGEANASVSVVKLGAKLSVTLKANPATGALSNNRFVTTLTAVLKNEDGAVTYSSNCNGDSELLPVTIKSATLIDHAFTFTCTYVNSGIFLPTVFVYDDSNVTVPVKDSAHVFVYDQMTLSLTANPDAGTVPFTSEMKVDLGNYVAPVSYTYNCNNGLAPTIPVRPATMIASNVSSANVSQNTGSFTFSCTYVKIGLNNPTVFVYDAFNTDNPLIATTKITVVAADTNRPPSKPIIDGPSSGLINSALKYNVVSTDPDGDQIYYEVTYKINTSAETNPISRLPFLGLVESGTIQNQDYAWTGQGYFIVLARAIDIKGATSDWGSYNVNIKQNEPEPEFEWYGTDVYENSSGSLPSDFVNHYHLIRYDGPTKITSYFPDEAGVAGTVGVKTLVAKTKIDILTEIGDSKTAYGGDPMVNTKTGNYVFSHGNIKQCTDKAFTNCTLINDSDVGSPLPPKGMGKYEAKYGKYILSTLTFSKLFEWYGDSISGEPGVLPTDFRNKYFILRNTLNPMTATYYPSEEGVEGLPATKTFIAYTNKDLLTDTDTANTAFYAKNSVQTGNGGYYFSHGRIVQCDDPQFTVNCNIVNDGDVGQESGGTKKYNPNGGQYILGTHTYRLGTAPVNHPPTAPIITGPNKGSVNDSLFFNSVSTDPDGDQIFYNVTYQLDPYIEINVISRLPSEGLVNSGTSQNQGYRWTGPGAFIVKAQAIDSKGATSEWSEYSVNISQQIESRFNWYGKSISANGNGLPEGFVNYYHLIRKDKTSDTVTYYPSSAGVTGVSGKAGVTTFIASTNADILVDNYPYETGFGAEHTISVGPYTYVFSHGNIIQCDNLQFTDSCNTVNDGDFGQESGGTKKYNPNGGHYILSTNTYKLQPGNSDGSNTTLPVTLSATPDHGSLENSSFTTTLTAHLTSGEYSLPVAYQYKCSDSEGWKPDAEISTSVNASNGFEIKKSDGSPACSYPSGGTYTPSVKVYDSSNPYRVGTATTNVYVAEFICNVNGSVTEAVAGNAGGATWGVNNPFNDGVFTKMVWNISNLDSLNGAPLVSINTEGSYYIPNQNINWLNMNNTINNILVSLQSGTYTYIGKTFNIPAISCPSASLVKNCTPNFALVFKPLETKMKIVISSADSDPVDIQLKNQATCIDTASEVTITEVYIDDDNTVRRLKSAGATISLKQKADRELYTLNISDLNATESIRFTIDNPVVSGDYIVKVKAILPSQGNSSPVEVTSEPITIHITNLNPSFKEQ